jgi:hypothetical protein
LFNTSGAGNLAHPGNPLMGLLGGGHSLPFGGDHTHAVIGLASIIHSLLGGGGAGAVSSLAGHLGGPVNLPAPVVQPPASGGQIHGFGPGGVVTGSPSGHIDTGYNPAQYRLATGDTQQAVADWEAHHPYAMAHHHIPNWVSQYLLHAIQGAAPPAPQQPAPPPPSTQYQ